ncbi:TPA: SdpI family protein [Bacillus cereus]|nr:SdpI family protein [Bacillus cereus]HDR7714514.1 SdpI family protein [Bacillus cereus]
MSVLIGVIFLIAAIILQKNPPTDINAVYGYRTKRSMKNKVLWDAGNRYSAEVMKQNGFIMMVIGSIISILFRYPHTTALIMVVMVLLIIHLFIRVENRLKTIEQ